MQTERLAPGDDGSAVRGARSPLQSDVYCSCPVVNENGARIQTQLLWQIRDSPRGDLQRLVRYICAAIGKSPTALVCRYAYARKWKTRTYNGAGGTTY